MGKKIKILFVAMAESIHTVRWLNQIKNEGWDLYLFPSQDYPGVHNNLTGIKLCIPFNFLYVWLEKFGLGIYSKFLYVRFANYKKKRFPGYYEKRLKKYIGSIRPDMIHSLETQAAGYLVAKVKCEYMHGKNFPVWWHTNWGSDIFLFGRIPKEKPLIRRVLENCEYYSCECIRDVELAREFGFNGTVFPVYPNTGGFDPKLIESIRAGSLLTSQRKIIMLKGYQGWAGRALVAIRALERCSELIGDYTIIIYSNSGGQDIAIAASLLAEKSGASVKILPAKTSHQDILKYQSQARLYIGLSIGDAISTSLLEAMAMGAFPIQSCTACANEWLNDGISGLIVTPEDPEVVETAIRKALLSDILVNSAAKINYDKILRDANFEQLKTKTIQSYKKIFNIEHV